MHNIIGDIAGNYETLLALLKKMPDGEVISVGDMIDRGPRSKEVVEWFMKNGKAILGNHEHMMLDFINKTHFYQEGIWFYNGGTATWRSFKMNIPDEVVSWMEKLPLYMEIDKTLVSHSFVDYDLQSSLKILDLNGLDSSILWNRHQPHRIPEYDMQIAGHNSQFGLRDFSDDGGVFAKCIDASCSGVLTGINLPSMQIFQQRVIDKE